MFLGDWNETAQGWANRRRAQNLHGSGFAPALQAPRPAKLVWLSLTGTIIVKLRQSPSQLLQFQGHTLPLTLSYP